jgi:hypothetical protein
MRTTIAVLIGAAATAAALYGNFPAAATTRPTTARTENFEIISTNLVI